MHGTLQALSPKALQLHLLSTALSVTSYYGFVGLLGGGFRLLSVSSLVQPRAG